MQRINDLDLTLEPLSDCLVQVAYQEQVGWFGVNLGEDSQDNPFAWTTDQGKCTQDGLLGDFSAAGPAQALEDLSSRLAEMQGALDSERASDPRHNLGAFLNTLPRPEVEEQADKEAGWRSRVGGGLAGLSRGKEILQDRAAKGKEILQDRAAKSKDVLQDRAAKSKDVLQDRAAKGREILQDRAAKGREILQDRTARGVEAVREAASPARACEREGHVFDDVRLIGSANNLPRFCRRCRNLISVSQEDGDTVADSNEGRQGTG